MSRYFVISIVLTLTCLGFTQEIKDKRILVDEVGLEANVGLPYIIGLGVSYSLKIRNIPVYPSFALKVGTGAIVKVEGLIGLNYRRESNLSYSFNFGYSGGETFVFDSHAGQPDKLVGLVGNIQRRKYIGSS